MEKAGLKQNNSINMVTFFKGVAIILVILVHSRQKFLLSDFARLVPRFGQMGCQIFFLLSAFGLCYSFSKGAQNWFGFMKKRLSKLYIGFYTAIFLHIVWRLLARENISIKGIMANAMFIHGLISNSEVNNLTVRGGWFVGTIVILYALFPLLFKLYNIKNEFWQKIRLFVFPLLSFGLSVLIIKVLESINPAFKCTNNSFMYFSFINQLTPFVLGICLYDIIENIGTEKIKLPLSLSLIFLAVTIKLFYARYEFSFYIVPTTMAVSIMLLFIGAMKYRSFNNAVTTNKNIIIKVITAFGKISFQIYLLHTFIVYDFIERLLPHLRLLQTSDSFWYTILLPIIYGLCFFIGFIFNKILDFCKRKKPA